MVQRWAGIVVAGDKVTLLDVEVGKSGPLVLQADQTWKLQSGDRAHAYCVMHQQISDYVRENDIRKVVIKASALSTGSTKMSHLLAAELRGVVQAAAALSCGDVEALAKAHISRTFGNRKVDEYIEDDDFWSAQIAGVALRSGSREAAMILLAARKD